VSARDLFLRLGLDLGLHRGDFEFAAQQCVDAAQARERVLDLEDLLRVFEAQLQIRGDQVREPPGFLYVRNDREHLGRKILQREQLLDARAHRAHHRFDLTDHAGSRSAGSALPGPGAESRSMKLRRARKA
jgi:hypothetical protein